MDDNSIHRAVEITKAAISAQSGWLSETDKIAKFIEVVATKIESLTRKS
ncbi:MAG TPA: hypothetical protein VIH56_04365 [Candidatus Acidoferrales bacterium]